MCLHSLLNEFLVSEKEIKDLEQSYYQLYSWGGTNNRQQQQQQISSQLFSNILSMVFPSILVQGVFEAFDENRDGKVNLV